MANRRGYIYRRGSIWWIKYHKNGEPYYESSGSWKKTVAIDLLNKRLASAAPVVNSKILIGELLDDYLDYFQTHHPKSFDSFGASRVSALRPFWGHRKADAISSLALKEYAAGRVEAGKSNATINREMSVLRKAFSLGREATPPKVGVSFPKFHRLPEAAPRKGFLEAPQYGALLEELPEEMKTVFVIGYHTGSRRGEVLRIQIEQVDLVDAKIRLYDTKKHVEGRWLPIYGDMVVTLKKQIEETQRSYPGCPWLCHKEGQRMVRLNNEWEKACARAGLSGLLFHDLRRSAVRNMIRAGIPEAVAMKISGHRSRAVFDRYNIVSGKDIEDAGKKLEEFMKGTA